MQGKKTLIQKYYSELPYPFPKKLVSLSCWYIKYSSLKMYDHCIVNVYRPFHRQPCHKVTVWKCDVFGRARWFSKFLKTWADDCSEQRESQQLTFLEIHENHCADVHIAFPNSYLVAGRKERLQHLIQCGSLMIIYILRLVFRLHPRVFGWHRLRI